MKVERPVRVRVTHRFRAGADRAFSAWLDPELIAEWMLASPIEDEQIVSISVDARVGGHFSFVVRRQGVDLDHRGEYVEIDAPRRLVFTWGVNEDPGETSRVTVDVEALAEGCEVTVTHEMHPKWADFAERTEHGWRRILEAMSTAAAPA